MEHLLSLRLRNWQGCLLFTQSLSFFSKCSHLLLNASGVISRCAEMRFISFSVKVGVMVLQQLAQLRQSTSRHTSASTCSASLSKPRGGFFSTLPRNLLKVFL